MLRDQFCSVRAGGKPPEYLKIMFQNSRGREWKRPLEKSWRTWKDNIKMYLRNRYYKKNVNKQNGFKIQR
jgi:hypothetical protein